MSANVGRSKTNPPRPSTPDTRPSVRTGTVLAFDFGTKRIGVAVGDFETRLAHPLTTIAVAETRARFAAIERLIAEWRPVLLVTLGYAGWAAGQLENELAQNAWLTVQAKPEVIFDMRAEERLPAAMGLLGIDFASLSEQAGHA